MSKKNSNKNSEWLALQAESERDFFELKQESRQKKNKARKRARQVKQIMRLEREY
jgi:hypothetical protein